MTEVIGNIHVIGQRAPRGRRLAGSVSPAGSAVLRSAPRCRQDAGSGEGGRRIGAILRALLLVLALAAGSLQAAPIGTAFTYQGALKDGGFPADGTFNFIFRLYDDETAGSQVGSDVTLNGVTVSGGLFTVELDFGAVFDGPELWLEIEVSGTVLAPRQNLTPTPYALYAAGPGGPTGPSGSPGPPGPTGSTGP